MKARPCKFCAARLLTADNRDDYMSKPFAFSELLARVEALLRRAGPAYRDSVLEIADLRLDMRTLQVTLGTSPVTLPGWHRSQPNAVSRDFGNRWYDQQRFAVLVVPSVLSAFESNMLIREHQPEARLIDVGEPLPTTPPLGNSHNVSRDVKTARPLPTPL